MTHASEPNYVLRHGSLALNAAGRDLTERMSETNRAMERLNRSWIGAFIAALFVDRPWLASFRLTIGASYEFDDSGGTYLSYWSAVSEVAGVDSCPTPAALCGHGALDADLVAEELRGAIECHERTFLEIVRGDGGGTATLTFRRCALAGLLDHAEIAGSAAYAALAID